MAVNAPALTPRAVSDIADKLVKRRLENVPGVGAVNLVGEAKREIQVVVDRQRLEAYGLSLAEVVEKLGQENVDAPAGTADRGSTEAMVRVTAQGRSAADIAAIPVKRVDERTVFVRDVAQVVDSVEEARSLAFVNDRPAIALDVQKQAGANTVGVADGVLAAVAALAPELPPGVALQVVRDDSTFIRESIEDVQVTLVLGGILTVFIVFLFLNSWRSTVITGLTLPISVVAAFIAMRFFGFTLNVLTLMGLSLAIGMLIDDAIVVRENIVRHMQRGKDHLDAARDGTAEIGLAVMATTFTIVAVFIPVAFMSGMVGQFFYQFGITVTAAVLVSLFVSFTLDPMLSSRWYDPDVEEDRRRGFIGRVLQRFNKRFDNLHATYERGLDWSLRHRWVVVAVAVVAFVSAFPILAVLGGDFMPDFNRGEYQVSFKSTPGATLRETGDRALEMVGRLRSVPDVEYTYTTIGEAGSSFRPVTEGSTYVKLKESRGRSFSEVLREGRRAVEVVPGLTFGFTEAGAFGQKPIQISVRGPEVEVLDRVSKEFVAEVRRVPGVADIESSLEKSKPELRIEIDRQRASDLGIPAATIATTLQAGVVGQVATTIEDSRGRQPQRARQAASRPKAVFRGSDDAVGADRQGRRLRRQDPEAAARGGGRAAGQRAVVDSAPGSRPGSARVREHRRAAAAGSLQRDHGGRGGDRAAGGLRHRRRRRHRGARQHVHQHVRGADPRGDLHLPDSGVPVWILHASSRDHAVVAALARRRGDHAVPDGGHAQHHEHDRPDHAHGARHEERHPARGLHQPGTRGGAFQAPGAAAGGDDAAASDRDDDAGDDLRDAAAGVCDWRGRRNACADGARGHRRADYLDAAVAAGRAGRLYVPRRFPARGAARLAEKASAVTRARDHSRRRAAARLKAVFDTRSMSLGSDRRKRRSGLGWHAVILGTLRQHSLPEAHRAPPR